MYLNRSASQRKMIDNFMEKNGIGMIAFIVSNNASRIGKQEQLKGFPVLLHNKLNAKVQLTFY
jgi:hypothetical protein